MVVAVHNPSNLEMKQVQIAVPHGNFVVKKFDYESWEIMKSVSFVDA